MRTEKRRTLRTSFSKPVQAHYTDDQGRDRFEIVQIQDLSASGCRVLLGFRCANRTLIALRLSPVHSGSATVRYQNPTPRGYLTGLEFLGGLSLPLNQ